MQGVLIGREINGAREIMAISNFAQTKNPFFWLPNDISLTSQRKT